MAPEMEKSFNVQHPSPAKPSTPVLLAPRRPSKAAFAMAQVALRVLAIFSTLIAIFVIVTDKQTITVFTVQFKARFKYSASYKFLVGADAVICAFSAFSLAFFHMVRRSESPGRGGTSKYYALFVHDTIMLVLAASACAAATAIGYVGQHGEPHMAWQSVCDEVPKFCNRMFLGCVFSYLGFFAYFALTLISARRLIAVPNYASPITP